MKNLLAAICTMFIAPNAFAAALVVDNGKLVGADGIQIGSALYNVRFVDGTCSAVFGSCTAAAFDFQTLNDAFMAALALRQQVFTGIYDEQPSLTAGCQSFGICQTNVPYSTTENYADVAFNVNAIPSLNDIEGVGIGGKFFTFDTTNASTENYAKFSLATSGAVPEPSTWAMMILGFGAVGYSLRKRQVVKTVLRVA